MKKYRFTVEIEIPDCDYWYEVADNLREIIQDRFDFNQTMKVVGKYVLKKLRMSHDNRNEIRNRSRGVGNEYR